MKRLALCIALLAAAAAPAPARADVGGVCGLPHAKPLWVDYGAPELKDVFARPGVVVAGSGEAYPAAMRAQGVQTVFWDMYLNRRIGTPSVPASPSLLPERAQRLFDFAVASSACATPVIVMNELFGASVTTPWTPTQARYRANVLQWVRLLAEKGAKPVMLVSSNPYTGGWDAAEWWRELAGHADIVLEKYFAAPAVHRAGPVLGNRRMRAAMRRTAAELFAVGIPPSKLGFMLAFQTKRGAGGREGLEAEKWFEVAKWQALAARQVARELGVAHVWSWGWGHFGDVATFDADKRGAACAWLWARDPRLCDAPAVLGDRFDPDRATGQIDHLPPGVRCLLGDRRITANEIGDLTRVTGDAELALSALFVRAVESRVVSVPTGAVLAAEREIVARRHGGSRPAYVTALRRAGATLSVARAVLADELRRDELERRLRVPAPSRRQILDFHETYARVPVRELGGPPAGVPASTPLGVLPLEVARPLIVRALREAARAERYRSWTQRAQKSALDEAVCERDRLPAIGAVDLTSYLPTLAPIEAR